MKIGIITQPLMNNYGGILQNYALQQILIKLGHEPVTIDCRPKNSFFWYLIVQCKTLLLYFLPSKRRPFHRFKPSIERKDQMSAFVTKYITTTHRLQKITPCIVKKYKFNAIICGSDQVWRPAYNQLDNTFLSFVKDRKVTKIAYAASFGVKVWEYSDVQTFRYSKLAKLFKAISVREKSGVDLCRQYLNVNAVETIDPTLLLRQEQYCQLCSGIQKSRDSYLAAYILDLTEGKKDFIYKIAKKMNLTVKLFSAEKDLNYTVEQWLSMFRDASYVITDSFHGTVFSIIFHKQFISIVNANRGNDRFESLLSKFELTERLIDVNVSNDFKDFEISWTTIENILDNERERSLNFLVNNLS